ncbi:MAG: DUF1624 domain-containing protein [Firmicutes bacterium]|jgi:uncharacterized membrane protein|nr:DUF1624 domain-containing protein [Bacillota bacterium]
MKIDNSNYSSSGGKAKRLVEIDAIRGLAVLAMVIYHFIYDLIAFYNLDFSLNHPIMLVLATAAYLFFFLFGLSSNFTRNPLKRLGRTALAALVITVSTYFFDPNLYVKFGTLHFLTAAGLIVYLLKDQGDEVIVLIAMAAFLIGKFIRQIPAQNDWLFPLGYISRSFNSSDYYPLFPNLTYVLLGYITGRKFYQDAKPIFPNLKAPFLSFLGRNAIIIYFVHQPLFLLLLSGSARLIK